MLTNTQHLQITPGVNYLEALCEDNVEAIVDDVTQVKAHSIVTNDGKERHVDSIVCATVSKPLGCEQGTY